METIAKTLILVGIVIALIGVIVYGLGKIPGAGRLTGDIVIKKDNFIFYFPIVTCVIISVIFSLIFYFWNLWNQK